MTEASSSHEVLGALAYHQLSTFGRLAADAELAPDLGQRIQLTHLAAARVAGLDRVLDRLAATGADAEAAVAPYLHLLDDFDARTEPSTWWERLLKDYVASGIADDVWRHLAAGLDEPMRGLVLDVTDDPGYGDLVVAAITQAGARDPKLAARLALWGRRLVGEALGAAQRLVGDHQAIGALLAAGAEPGTDAAALQSRLFAALTAEHTRRMDRMGLTA